MHSTHHGRQYLRPVFGLVIPLLVTLVVCSRPNPSAGEESSPPDDPSQQAVVENTSQKQTKATPPPRPRPTGRFERRAVTLTDGVHLLGELEPGSAYAVETKQGLVLVDAGLEADAALVLSQLEELGLAVADLQAIFITHVHGDHSLGARQLREMSGAKIYAGHADCEALESGSSRAAFFSTFSFPDIELHPTRIDVRLRGGEVLELGDGRMHCLATPGHTPGSFCFLLERPGETVLFTGDTVTSFTAGLGTYAAHYSPRYLGDANAYLDSLQLLRSMPLPDWILPGHPRLESEEQTGQLSESEWHDLLDGGIEEMRTLILCFEEDGRDFLDGEAKQLLPGLFYLGEQENWAQYCLVTAERLFLVDAPPGPGLAASLEDRLRQWNVKRPEQTIVLLTACDDAAAGGLPDLTFHTNCTVVAPTEAHADLRSRCAPETRMVDTEELEELGWLTVRVVATPGLESSSIAYQIHWQQSTVLLTGRFPTGINQTGTAKISKELRRELRREAKENPDHYSRLFGTLLVLEPTRPDLWLPARPAFGQNANIYAKLWGTTIRANRRLVEQFR